MSRKVEKPIELVSYNLMMYLRKKLNNYHLCKKDFTHEQKESFEKKVKECFAKGLLLNNPFADEERILTILIESELLGEQYLGGKE